MKKFLLLFFALFISRSLLSADASHLEGLESKVIELANKYKPDSTKPTLGVKSITRTEKHSPFSLAYKAEFNQVNPQPGEFDRILVDLYGTTQLNSPEISLKLRVLRDIQTFNQPDNQVSKQVSCYFNASHATKMLELLICLHHQREQIGSAQKQE